MDLDAHLRDELLLPGKLRQLPRFIEVVRQRLLAIDMFAQLHRGHRHRRVHVVRRRDVDRIEILRLLVQQLAPVLINLHVGMMLLELRRPLQIHLRHRDQLQRLALHQFAQIVTGHAGRPEAGMTQHAVGRLRHQTARNKRRGQTPQC